MFIKGNINSDLTHSVRTHRVGTTNAITNILHRRGHLNRAHARGYAPGSDALTAPDGG